MKKAKIFYLLIIVLITMSLLAACAGTNTPPADNGTTNPDTTVKEPPAMLLQWKDQSKKTSPETIKEDISTLLTDTSIQELTITFDSNFYQLNQPIVLSGEEIPALADIALNIKGTNGGTALSGLQAIDNTKLQVTASGIYVYQFEKDANGSYPQFHDLYYNGRRLEIAKSEKFVHPFGFADKNNRENPKNMLGLYLPDKYVTALNFFPSDSLEFTIEVEWECATLHPTGFDLESTKTSDGDTYMLTTFRESELETFVTSTNSGLNIKNRVAYFSNHLLFLKNAGQFVYKYDTGTLYFIPPAEFSMEDQIAFPMLENLLVLNDLSNITVSDLTFTGASSHYICQNGYIAGQANNVMKVGRLDHAALLTKNTENFKIQNCSFIELGANGLLMTDRSVGVSVTDCIFEGIGMSALRIGNSTVNWQDPKNQTFNLTVENNLFRNIGFSYPTSAACYVGMVDGMKFLHNTIQKTAYSGLSVGWGWTRVDYAYGEQINIRNAEIAYNRILDYMEELKDGAAIYVLGANCTRDYKEHFNFMHDNYAARATCTDNSKRGYYLDGSASNWEVYNNVTSGVKLSVFSQYDVEVQYTYNNYIHDIYTTEAVPTENHAPLRNTIVENIFYQAGTVEALFDTYPKALEIYNNSGYQAKKVL